MKPCVPAPTFTMNAWNCEVLNFLTSTELWKEWSWGLCHKTKCQPFDQAGEDVGSSLEHNCVWPWLKPNRSRRDSHTNWGQIELLAEWRWLLCRPGPKKSRWQPYKEANQRFRSRICSWVSPLGHYCPAWVSRHWILVGPTASPDWAPKGDANKSRGQH